MKGHTPLRRFVESILFIEQPIHRSAALQVDLTDLSRECPVIIDESDEDLDAFPRAVRAGYLGVSSKQCKGIYKSIINGARCEKLNRASGKSRFFMSGEDLTTQPGIAVQQDLALAASLGIRHLERNGHHYVKGMQDIPEKEQEAFLQAHPDLYRRDEDLVRLEIRRGVIRIGSLRCGGFAATTEPDWNDMERVF
jgi:hypothetical protein